jgi:hypothetical protein
MVMFASSKGLPMPIASNPAISGLGGVAGCEAGAVAGSVAGAVVASCK